MSETMQLQDLIGRKVVDPEGKRVGHIDEISLEGVGTDYEVEGLIIGLSALLQRFGVAAALTRLERVVPYKIPAERNYLVKWEQIDDYRADPIKLKVSCDALEQYRPVVEPFD